MNQSSVSKKRSVPARLPGLMALECGVQHYAWGDPRFIPHLLGVDNPEARPFAELWMGAHPDLPSKVVLEGRRVGLDELVAAAPVAALGSEVSGEYENPAA